MGHLDQWYCSPANIAEQLHARHKAAIIHGLIATGHGNLTVPVMITELKGSSDLVVARLAETGIYEAAQLLKQCETASQRRALSSSLEIDEKELLALANRADLARIRGVAGVYADLLETAGVDTVRELATRRPDHLFEKLTQVNTEKRITATPPTKGQIEKWIERAKNLDPVLSY